MDKIDDFEGEHRWLSNFWPVKIIYGERTYTSVENAYQAAKFPEPKRWRFLSCSPASAKRMARSEGMRLSKMDTAAWDAAKVPIMHALLLKKFKLGSNLALWLENTGDAELIEGNTWGDKFWGVCDGVGENQLGKLLMEVRATNREAVKEMVDGQ